MTWKPFAEVEAELGTRLYRKVSAGALPTYTDGRGQRFVWMQQGGSSLDDVLWDVLAELRTVRSAVERLERQAAEAHAAATAATAAATAAAASATSAASAATSAASGTASTAAAAATSTAASKIISLRTRRPVHDAEQVIAEAEALRARLGISERELLRRAGLSDPAFLCKARRGLKRDRAAQATWARLAAFLAREVASPSASGRIERAA